MSEGDATAEPIEVRVHGAAGPWVVVLHGGPGDGGGMAEPARALADSFRVLEPWQRRSGGPPLTVNRHIEDLHDAIGRHCEGAHPAVVGASWGAMLALAYAAAYPPDAGPLVLVGCGTFDPAARARLRETLEKRTHDALRRGLEQIEREVAEPSERMRRRHELSEKLYVFDPLPRAEPGESDEPFDLRGHTETWNDMRRLQAEGVYPAAFEAISSPVLMLHGDYDPHPGRMIRESLAPHIPHLEYRELERCGHDPWRERDARGPFFAVLRDWLWRHSA